MSTHTATVPASAIHATASLVPFAASGRDANMSPTIGTVALSFAGQEFHAVATDRYVVGDYAVTLPEEFGGELPQVMVTAPDIAAIVKRLDRNGTVTLRHDEEARTLVIEHATGAMTVQLFHGNYPPVSRLFTEQGPMHEGTIMLNVEFLAKLAKFKHPGTGKAFSGVQPWEFGQTPDTYGSGKPTPVYASATLDSIHRFRALIQPNLKLR